MPQNPFTVTISGLDRTKQNLAKIGSRAAPELAAGLFKEATDVLNKAREEVPVDTGALRSTGAIRSLRSNLQIEIGFGGAKAPYAVFVHEDLTKHHPVGKAKYLEDPYKRALRNMDARLASFLRSRFPETR